METNLFNLDANKFKTSKSQSKHCTRKLFVPIILSMLILTMIFVISGCTITTPPDADPVEISPSSETFPTTYALDQTIPSGATITVKYSDDSLKFVFIKDVEIRGFDSSTPGTKTIEIIYKGLTCSVEILVTDILESISTKDDTIKEFYGIGETLANNACIIADWKSGSDTEISITPDMMSNWDTSTIGQKTVKVSYGGKTTSFNMTVSGNIFSSTIVENTHAYFVDDEFKGATLELIRYDGTSIKRSIDNTHISQFNTTETGQITVGVEYTFSEDSNSPEVKYNNTLVIDVLIDEIQRIELDSDFQSEYLVGESFVTSNLIATFTSGPKNIPITFNMVSNFITDTAGKRDITINHLGKSTSGTISVRELVDIVIHSFNYEYQTDADFTPGTINALYSDTESVITKNIPLTANMVTGFDTSTKGIYPITISYGEESISTYIIVDLEIDYIEIDSETFAKLYEQNDEFCSTSKIKIHFTDASYPAELVVIDERMLVNSFDSSKPGRKIVEIKFLNFDSITAEVCVSGSVTVDDFKLDYLDSKYGIQIQNNEIPSELTENFQFEFGYMLSQYSGNSSDIIIPTGYNGIDVICAAPKIFSMDLQIESITLSFLGFAPTIQTEEVAYRNFRYLFDDKDSSNSFAYPYLKTINILEGLITE
ncbi:MAG: bacterial Ig-like domain-containing protein, partial [Christensenellaceae bacterium]|nr:bacterial Ig-like domain-containing protein [Christensenellaceae bacterium]